jgi:hypothetical protein
VLKELHLGESEIGHCNDSVRGVSSDAQGSTYSHDVELEKMRGHF